MIESEEDKTLPKDYFKDVIIEENIGNHYGKIIN